MIDGLVDEAEPVPPRKLVRGLLWTATGWLVGAALFLWLRSGAAGASIVALHCVEDNLIHIALWHGLAVVVSAVAGRLILPRFLRW